jgi:hypothetical protein
MDEVSGPAVSLNPNGDRVIVARTIEELQVELNNRPFTQVD